MKEDSIFSLDSDLNNLWVWCLSKASHINTKWDFIVKGRGKIFVELLPGQFVCGRHSMAKSLGSNPSTTWKRLKMLKSHGFISIKSDKKYSIVTILNWNSYKDTKGLKEQVSEQDTELDCEQDTELDCEQETRQQHDTKKNVKKVNKLNNVKKYIEEIIIPEWLPTTEWNLFLDMRKKIKKLPTEHAKKLLIRDLDALRAAGENIAEVLNQSIKFNWQGLFEIKNQNTGSKKFTPIPLTPEEKTEKERYEALSPEEQKREDDRSLMKYACEQAKKERERYD